MTYNVFVGALKVSSTKAGNIFIGTNLITYYNKAQLKDSQVVLSESYAQTTKLQSLNIAIGPVVQLHKRPGKFS